MSADNRRWLVLVTRTPAFDPALAQPHRDFLARLEAAGQLECTGSFSDGSGGAYVLRHLPDVDAARALVAEDPITRGGAATLVVHEWLLR